jgi:hypothetical protein
MEFATLDPSRINCFVADYAQQIFKIIGKMDPSLRKTHRRIWIVLTILLPILFVAVILVLPKDVEQDTLYQDTDPAQIQQLESKDSNKK